MKKLKLAFIGCGSRVKIYSQLAAASRDKYELVAAADLRPERVSFIEELSDCENFKTYQTGDELLADRPEADVIVIGTQDQNHFEPCMKALKAGYDVMVEKPLSTDLSEIKQIESLATKLKRRVMVCHVLRYTPFYKKVKRMVTDGLLGEIINVRAVEGINPWHFSHSYVRGHWSDTSKSSPMIVAKCCHDLDIIRWLIGKPCKKLSSYGELSYFKSKKEAETLPDRCYDNCPQADTCFYNAAKYTSVDFRKTWLSQVYDRYDIADDQEVMEWLESSDWGRCVYKCDNNAVDHQVVNLDFGDCTASFTATAFEHGRHLELFGTKAVLKGGDFYRRHMGADLILEDHQGNILEKVFFELSEEAYHHMGGDEGLIEALYEQMVIWPLSKSHDSLSEVVEGHELAFRAEESRLEQMS